MEMEYVDSSSIDQIGYDETQGECHVVFKDGRHYIYSDVTQETWDNFRGAESHGKFLNAEFKRKGYQYREL
ncbi:KTSC domain-containing protein [Hoeflea alexandrii]|uniref:KTSC domain-containing protein n=1 Tax=Hoeflea alexandrii TaxID=288436 RepID=UPI0035D04CF3